MVWPSVVRYGRMVDPFDEIQRLQQEMNRLFSGFGPAVVYEFPPINAWVSEDDAVLTAELPGIDPEKLDISVVGDTLTLSGERAPASLGEGETYHRQERNFGKFARTLRLPFQVDPTKVEAKYEKGILRITLPRSEQDKPKKIAIKTN